jgi:pimeloyl-ACP methyl ester carboxylesterase
MAKLMSKKTRETVTTTTVLIVILLFVGFYIIYPLIVVGDMVTAPKTDESDTAPGPDLTAFSELSLSPDTFTVITDDNIELAGLLLKPDSLDSLTGTAIIVPGVNSAKETFASLAAGILATGNQVAIYDQRAAGASTGEYRSPGVYESDDLNQFVVHLKLHDQLYPPVTVIGFQTGADAAVLAAQKEDYLDRIIAVRPYLSAGRWIRALKNESGTWSIPFASAVYFWWYQKKSGFPLERTGPDDIMPVDIPTVLIAEPDDLSSTEYRRLIEQSENRVSSTVLPPENDDLNELIIKSLNSRPTEVPGP